MACTRRTVGRREFARRGALAGVAACLPGTAIGARGQPSLEPRLIGDLDILNFLLNLEYLQAEFYTVANSGRRIADYAVATTGHGSAADTIGGAQVGLGEQVRGLAAQLAVDERAHVQALRTRLGAAAVAKPAINLEALGFGFRSETEFIILARLLEDLVMTTCQGVMGLLGDAGLQAAARDLGFAEAQHASAVRTLVTQRGLVVPRFDAVDVPPPPSPDGRLFNADDDGMSLKRSASQALAVLYRTSVQFANAGGFFPSGLNGVVRNV